MLKKKTTHLPKASKAEEPVSYPFPLGTAEEACDAAMMVAGSWLEKLKRDGGRLNRCLAPPTSKQQALCECSNFVDVYLLSGIFLTQFWKETMPKSKDTMVEWWLVARCS